MLVSGISLITKKKAKISTYEGITFALYLSELGRFEIEVEKEIEEGLYRDKILPLLLSRSKARVMYILKDSDKSELELRQRLKASYYPEEAVDKALEWALGQRYIDDARYAAFIAESRKGAKSRKQLYVTMKQKGIAEEIILKALDEAAIDEEDLIKKLLKKKQYAPDKADIKARARMFNYLMSKGFEVDMIKSCLKSE